MFRPAEAILIAGAVLLALPALGQTMIEDDADAIVEAYMSERGLRGAIAAHLREKLDDADAEQRTALAERLGEIYVEMLADAQDPAERIRVERLAEDLLKRVPEAQSYELRINVAKASYLSAESAVERQRLRLADVDEVAEAERVLRAVTPTFREIASKAHRRVESLERRELRGVDDAEELREQLADARRTRSLAMYYSGWSSYYLAELTGQPNKAKDALRAFGWLLNSDDGREASVDRVSPRLLRYDHVARAAMGCAITESLLGEDVRAIRWLELLDETAELSPGVREQMFARRTIVLATARRWADLRFLIDRKPLDDEGRLLNVNEARLLAVLTLESLDASDTWSGREGIANAIAQIALGELVQRGEIGHVLDLVSRYGTAPIGDDGFVVRYVRGLRAYERAREAQTEAGDDPDKPSADNHVKSLFDESARSLESALIAEDSAEFGQQRDRCGILLGLSQYYADRLEQSAETLSAVVERASGEQREQAMWYAIVALDKAVEGGAGHVIKNRDMLATLYLESYPTNERAAKLLIRRVADGLMSPKETSDILLAVSPESPLYEPARRHAANLLYQLYRRGQSTDRSYAADRFADVAWELITLDKAALESGTDPQSADRLFVRLRQLLDVALGSDAPDIELGRRALRSLDDVLAFTGQDREPIAGEIAFRKLQLAMALGDESAAETAIVDLDTYGGPFADAAERMLFKRALQAWDVDPRNADHARDVVRHGLKVIVDLERTRGATDPMVRNAIDTVAEAAAAIWDLERDEFMRDTAIELDVKLEQNGDPSPTSLRRLALLYESAGRNEPALDAWLRLLNGADRGTDVWYEARYESLRLLAQLDPPRARVVLDQHTLLTDGFGPEPWGPRLEKLDRELPPPEGDQ